MLPLLLTFFPALAAISDEQMSGVNLNDNPLNRCVALTLDVSTSEDDPSAFMMDLTEEYDEWQRFSKKAIFLVDAVRLVKFHEFVQTHDVSFFRAMSISAIDPLFFGPDQGGEQASELMTGFHDPRYMQDEEAMPRALGVAPSWGVSLR